MSTDVAKAISFCSDIIFKNSFFTSIYETLILIDVIIEQRKLIV